MYGKCTTHSEPDCLWGETTLAMLSFWSCIQPFICCGNTCCHNLLSYKPTSQHRPFHVNHFLQTKRNSGNCIYNYVHGNLPHSLSDIFAFTSDIHFYQTRQTCNIVSSFQKPLNNLLFKDPIIWNILATLIQINPIFKWFCIINKQNWIL